MSLPWFARRFLICLLLGLVLQGCSHTALLPSVAMNTCTQELAAFEERARAVGLSLSEPRSVPAFPALGSNRFLASFDPRTLDEEQTEAWLQRLLDAGQRRRAQLTAMLAVSPGNGVPTAVNLSALETCAEQQMANYPRSDTALLALTEALQVADDYSLLRRGLGLYPLTSLAAKAGVGELQTELRHSYTVAPAQLPREGQIHFYAPADDLASVSGEFPVLQRDALGVLLPDVTQMGQLLAQHAPIWAVDTVGDFDRPGRPFFEARHQPRVDESQALTYNYASLTRIGGEPHLQLNYLMWFDARPKVGVLDTLGGRLDGLIWRVTLDSRGRVLLYDSVHACGCYQLYFNSPHLRLRGETETWPEPPLVMAPAPDLRPRARPVLWVSSAAHYLQGLSSSTVETLADLGAGQDASEYVFEDYTALYGVPHPKGKRSLFDRHGVVRGSERSERLYLWPMGIRSPGAMRERGRHATAFIGRRHFDDADLVDQLFVVEKR